MSENDSFLDEVTEEVRRDKMVAFLRRNAVWFATGAIVIIGGAAFLEWQKASERAAAEARGDALWAAINTDLDAGRADALAQVEMAAGDGEALVAMSRAAALAATDKQAEAIDLLQGIAGRGDVSDPLRDVARIKLAGIGAGSLSPQEREDLLLPMLQENHAMRALALEQRALLRLETGDTAAAIEDLTEIGNDPRAPSGVPERADQLLAILQPGDAADG